MYRLIIDARETEKNPQQIFMKDTFLLNGSVSSRLAGVLISEKTGHGRKRHAYLIWGPLSVYS